MYSFLFYFTFKKWCSHDMLITVASSVLPMGLVTSHLTTWLCIPLVTFSSTSWLEWASCTLRPPTYQA